MVRSVSRRFRDSNGSWFVSHADLSALGQLAVALGKARAVPLPLP